jgi:DNA-binding transcriptional regulator YiaG
LKNRANIENGVDREIHQIRETSAIFPGKFSRGLRISRLKKSLLEDWRRMTLLEDLDLVG